MGKEREFFDSNRPLRGSGKYWFFEPRNPLFLVLVPIKSSRHKLDLRKVDSELVTRIANKSSDFQFRITDSVPLR